LFAEIDSGAVAGMDSFAMLIDDNDVCLKSREMKISL
jgi:hypothetical protein